VQDIQNAPSQLNPARKTNLRSGLIAEQISNGINLAASRALAQLEDSIQNNQPLDDILQANPQLQGLARFSPAGKLQDNVWRAPELKANAQSFAQNEVFYAAQQGVNAQGAPFISRYNAPLVTVAAPIVKDNTVTGVLMAWVGVQNVWQSLTDLPVGKTGYLYIIDQTERPIITPAKFAAATPPAALQTNIQSKKTYFGLNKEKVMGRSSPVEKYTLAGSYRNSRFRSQRQFAYTASYFKRYFNVWPESGNLRSAPVQQMDTTAHPYPARQRPANYARRPVSSHCVRPQRRIRRTGCRLQSNGFYPARNH
jgi:hypothetical protein